MRRPRRLEASLSNGTGTFTYSAHSYAAHGRHGAASHHYPYGAARSSSRRFSTRRKTMTQLIQRTRSAFNKTVKHAAVAGVLLASAVTAMAQTDSPVGT